MELEKRYECKGKDYTIADLDFAGNVKLDANGKTIYITKICEVKAKDAKADIDIKGINTSCDKIREKFDDLKEINDSINTLVQQLDKTVLSVEGKEATDLWPSYYDMIKAYNEEAKDKVSSVNETAHNKFNELQKEYNDTARDICKIRHGL